MYNTNLILTYSAAQSEPLYQQELLQAFQVEQCEQLMPCIDALYETIPRTLDFKALMTQLQSISAFPLNEDMAFYLLFSFDYFSYAHTYLVEVLRQGETPSYAALMQILAK
jgi:hypothetical protein